MSTFLIIALLTISYSFVGLVTGKIAYQKTKNSLFWEETIAAFLMFCLWPVAIPSIWLYDSAEATVEYLNKREEKKLLKAAEKKRLLEEAEKEVEVAMLPEARIHKQTTSGKRAFMMKELNKL